MTVTSRTTKKGKQSNEKALQEWNLQPGVKTSEGKHARHAPFPDWP